MYIIDKESINSLLLILYLFISSLTIPLNQLMNNGISVWIATILILCISIYVNKVNININLFYSFLIIFIFFSINLLIIDYQILIIESIIIPFIKFGLIPLYLASQVKKIDLLLKYWFYIGIINLAVRVLFIDQVINEELGYMAFGIDMTYSFIIFSIYFYYKKKYRLLNLLLMTFSFILVLFFGNRSASLTCLLIIAFFELKLLKERNVIYALFKSLSILTIVALLFVNAHLIFIYLKNIINNFGYSSYVIDKMIFMFNNGFTEASSGRDQLYVESVSIIKNSYLMPKGIGYYQYITGSNYPHNILLDLLITFGILAVPLILFFIILYIKRYNLADGEKKIILSTLLIFVIVRLMFSGTFWYEEVFWIIMGLMISKATTRVNTQDRVTV